MGSYGTKCSAVTSIAHMKKMGFWPKTVINIGIGCCPELQVWKKGLQGVKLLGVDIRNKGWDAPWINGLVSDNKCNNQFCWKCKSLKCIDPLHIKVKYDNVTTIDDIVKEKELEPPFFLWIDIEGGELDALKGAKKTLLDIPLITIEMREFAWTTNYKQELHEFLESSGYRFIDTGPINGLVLEDKIYERVNWSEPAH